MKLIRFIYQDKEWYGELIDDFVALYKGDIATGLAPAGVDVALADIKLLSPVKPSKAVCVGLNYIDHIEETNAQRPDEPCIFIKPSTSVIGPGESIIRPAMSRRVDYEGELAIVISRTAKNIPEEMAAAFIFGYTCANDVTARDLQSKDGQWTRGKGFDTFLPIGPCIETDINPAALPIRTCLNGKTVQDSNTKYLLFGVEKMVSFVSQVMTLLPGDVILTGTSSGIGPMVSGDTVAVEIEGIGRLENPVIDPA
ncbi:MAG: fumarylacetoacetate hydrolase family protein [Oscillospiraceae bacterium]|jgi:2-keto-4-pentenoate hydratase/2-oxohepta-3-ene-1,7-dioic acid hydratase in catechol pathway|nr:fumarylacetoacetate hydrolase family protein [Oscillospiraceae bacterium]